MNLTRGKSSRTSGSATCCKPCNKSKHNKIIECTQHHQPNTERTVDSLEYARRPTPRRNTNSMFTIWKQRLLLLQNKTRENAGNPDAEASQSYRALNETIDES